MTSENSPRRHVSETVSDPEEWNGRTNVPIGADEAFNGYIAANVVFALDGLGILDELDANGSLRVSEFVQRGALDGQLIHALLTAAETVGYITTREDLATLTDAGKEAALMRSFFTWSVGGYGDVFSSISSLVKGESHYGADITRDESMVALGSGQSGTFLMSSIFEDALQDVDFHTIADLGSGTANRLCRVVKENDGSRGIAIDISLPATQIAQRNIHEQGLGTRVQAIRADVLDVVMRREHESKLADVDTVMSFFLLHDLLVDPTTRASVLPRMREAFPAAKTFLLADTVIRPTHANQSTLPIFSAGYELAHALMGVPLYTRQAYERLFDNAGLRIRRVVPFGVAHTWLYTLDCD
ncbi:class I SAM-dependent methyltransferase [Streptomyces prasinus]|uniref:class I SAM-dependent methyltransferase n=1 Tax=Streptomyces prasinus TaxID=67345 RepID=UPI0007C8555C|nr:class I SAM-dependent methyltransferase [Streptomyces prasinus]